MRQALDIVKAQAGFRSMTEDEMASMIKNLAVAIRQIKPEDDAAPSAPEQAVGEKSITCLECGKNFKLITKKHLLAHGLSPDEYKDKWGYSRNTPLICKKLQKERRKKMRNMKLWERRRKGAQALELQ